MLQDAISIQPLPLGLREVSIVKRDPETPAEILEVAKKFKVALLAAHSSNGHARFGRGNNPSSWASDRHTRKPLPPISYTGQTAQM
jgi:hypothetical protein